MKLEKNNTRLINAWVMYDWANSVYILVITSAVFPAYYNTVTRVNGSTLVDVFGFQLQNTGIYSICMGLAFGVVAMTSPLLSSIADYTGRHKAFMRFFCYLGALGCMSLFFFDHVSRLYLGLAAFMIATIGYSGSIVFYNAYLPSIATEDRQDQVSAKGFSFGYLGSTILLLLCLVLILNKGAFGVTDGGFMPRVAFLLTGLWWVGFAQITFNRLPSGLYAQRDGKRNVLHGYQELLKIWGQLRDHRLLKLFLFSFFFYIMGVQTVMMMAGPFGEKEVGLKLTQLIITIMVLEYVGIAGSYLFAFLSRKMGNLPALTLAVAIWIGNCVGALFIQTPLHFYIAGAFIGLVMGGVQSLSRSTYAKMLPSETNNAGFFSFYDVSEKLAMMCGLVLFGVMDNLTGSMRNAIVTLILWFVIALIILLLMRRK